VDPYECPECGDETAVEDEPCSECAEYDSALGEADDPYDSDYEDRP
jgi:predicted ATP-dependent serine protease